MRKMYFDLNLSYIIHQENLEEDFKRTMKSLGYAEEYVDGLKIELKNQSKHLPFMQYYTSKYKDLVLRKDKDVMMHFYQ